MPKYVTIPTVGDTVNDQYVLGEVIGEGAFGKVYEARQLDLDRRVAVKILHPRIATHEQLIERFKREATVASSLRHRNSVTILEYGVFGGGEGTVGLPFIAMEFLDGEDLAAHLESKGKLEFEEGLAILTQAVSSLAEAHQKGIIHRDIKPQNLFVCSQKSGEPFVKVLDFGIAKLINDAWGSEVVASLTKTGAICGTPAYMAPEQAAGSRDLTAAADVYSLGCIAYELFAGVPPFTASNPMTVALKHMTEPVPVLPPPYEGTGLDRLVQRALAKAPGDRFADAAALLDALGAEVVALRSPVVSPAPSSDSLEHRVTISLTEVPALVRQALETAPTFQMDLDPAQVAALASGLDVAEEDESEPTVLLRAPSLGAIVGDLGAGDGEGPAVPGFDSMPTKPLMRPDMSGGGPSAVPDDDDPTVVSIVSPAGEPEGARAFEGAPASVQQGPRRRPAAVERRRDAPKRHNTGPTSMSGSSPAVAAVVDDRPPTTSVGGGRRAFVVAIVLLCLGGLAAVGVAGYYGADLIAPARETATVHLVSQPPGAVVIVEGREVGVTPLNLPASGGVLLRKGGFTDAERAIAGQGGRTLTVTLKPVK